MEQVDHFYLELKRQIWEKCYDVNDIHWTQMVLNLELIMNEFHKQKKLLDILKEFLQSANTGTGWLEINIDPNHDVLDSKEHKEKQKLINSKGENDIEKIFTKTNSFS